MFFFHTCDKYVDLIKKLAKKHSYRMHNQAMEG